jgi:hypothetical protein
MPGKLIDRILGIPAMSPESDDDRIKRRVLESAINDSEHFGYISREDARTARHNLGCPNPDRTPVTKLPPRVRAHLERQEYIADGYAWRRRQ